MPGLTQHLPQSLPRWCVRKGVLPFALGAARQHQRFRSSWRSGVPRSFNEKLQYKLIYDRRPVIRIYSDKLAVRAYVRRRAPGLALPMLLGVFDRVSDLLEQLPAAPWVMKASHGSGMVLLCRPLESIRASEISRHAHAWLMTDYALRYWEWQYYRLPRRVMFEEYLGAGAAAPPDYKFYMIHQQVRLITVDQGRFVDHRRNLFRPDWTEIPSRKGHTPRASPPPPRPKRLEEMMAWSALLARDSDFVRVDLYCVNDTLFFGELTHAPAAGDMDFEDPVVDAEMGSYWDLPVQYG